MYIVEKKIILADTVHHIDQLKDNWERRIDIDNLISLNHDTHSMIEKIYLREKEKIMRELYEALKEYRRIMKP